MLIFDALKRNIVKNTDVSKAKVSIPIADIPESKRTVISDILDNPQSFKLEAYLEEKEIVIRIKPRKGDIVDLDEEYAEDSEETGE